MVRTRRLLWIQECNGSLGSVVLWSQQQESWMIFTAESCIERRGGYAPDGRPSPGANGGGKSGINRPHYHMLVCHNCLLNILLLLLLHASTHHPRHSLTPSIMLRRPVTAQDNTTLSPPGVFLIWKNSPLMDGEPLPSWPPSRSFQPFQVPLEVLNLLEGKPFCPLAVIWQPAHQSWYVSICVHHGQEFLIALLSCARSGRPQVPIHSVWTSRGHGNTSRGGRWRCCCQATRAHLWPWFHQVMGEGGRCDNRSPERRLQ